MQASLSLNLNSPLFSLLVLGTAFVPNQSAYTAPMHGEVPPSTDEIVRELAATEERKQFELQSYSATRRYVLKNERFKQDAEMLVRMQVSADKGKTFQIITEHGVEGISRRVFKKVLDGEAEASRTDAKHLSKVTPQNYDFRMLGMEERYDRRCYVLEIKPRLKSKYLLDGKIWVDVDDYQLVRMEGRTGASLSFWVGKPYIVYDFQKVGDTWLAARNQAMTNARFLGATELTIEVQAYEIRPGCAQKLALEKLPQLLQKGVSE